MALEDFLESFIFMDYVSVPDGLGGLKYEFREGASFSAGIAELSSTEATIAYRNGLKTIFRITTKLGVELEQNDVVKRVKDGRLYRITSNAADTTTPDVAVVKHRWCTAEVME